MIASDTRWALLHEQHGAPPSLPDLIARMAPVDLLLIEGFRDHPHPKIEVHRPSLGLPPIWPGRTDIAAVACDAKLHCDRPLLDLNDPPAIAAWVLSRLPT
jgi:molybdopterin-guanine dinucleotide biosynthesis protein B